MRSFSGQNDDACINQELNKFFNKFIFCHRSASLKGLCRPGANQGGTDQVTELRVWCDVMLRLCCVRQRVLDSLWLYHSISIVLITRQNKVDFMRNGG